MNYRLFWGDLHSHCSVSYGEGTVQQALARARQQIDFCSITGHAFWPDMPANRERYGEIIDYHRTGFARLAENWSELLEAQAEASEPGEFLALPSYEWHSLQYGDHNVYAPRSVLPLRDAPDLPALRAMAAEEEAIIVPHHIGYKAGFRGIDWKHFREDRTPLVEIFSLHGCSESDSAPFPMLHDMGPRDAGSTAAAGWRAGHRFGVVGGSDHHGAYPGSHGDGRMGVFATALTRDALWQAFLERRVYAATGDKIDARLFVDDAWIGEAIQAPGKRRLRVAVRGADAIDRVEVLRGEQIIRRLYPEVDSDPADRGPFRLRITWGWGRKDRAVPWEAKASLSAGSIQRVESCFSGRAIAAPQGVAGHETPADEEDLPHEVVEQSERACAWRSITTGNPSMRQASTQALSLELEAPLAATLTIEVNGQACEHRLEELLRRGRCHFLRGWLSEAIQIGPLVPIGDCTVNAEFEDEPHDEVDCYRLRAAQSNGHWVWLTPIWVER